MGWKDNLGLISFLVCCPSVMLALPFATVTLQSIIRASSAFGQQTGPQQCLAMSPSISELVTCLDKFTVREGYYTPETYAAAQPTADQRADWDSVINSLLDANGNCASTTIPSSLEKIYTVQAFRDNCVLYEKSILNGTYVKGWGTMIVPRSRFAVERNIHFSAPHPGWELETIQQAASLFQSTHSRSLLLPGRNHNASTEISDCMPGAQNYKTDVAINTLEPFFDANVAIHNWQLENDACSTTSCAFIQLRGKGQWSCPSDMIFLSAGLGNSIPSIEWYTDSTPRPVKALQKSLRISFPMWEKDITLPSDSDCSLTDTMNVVGRYLNGVQVSDVCHTGVTSSKTATGQFVRVGQAIAPRNPKLLGIWSQAVIDAFPPITHQCLSGGLFSTNCNFFRHSRNH